MGRVNSIPSTFVNFLLRKDIPGSKLQIGDGGLVFLQEFLKMYRNMPHRFLQQYLVEFDRSLEHILILLKGERR